MAGGNGGSGGQSGATPKKSNLLMMSRMAAGSGSGQQNMSKQRVPISDVDEMNTKKQSNDKLLYIQDHPAVRPDLCRVIICTTFLLASTAFWWLANCCGIIFLYFAASWTCLFFVLLVTSLIGFGLKVRAEEVKDTRREKCERSDASDTSRSIRFKDLLMLRSFRVIKYRECEEALEVAQAVSTLSSRIQAQAAATQPTTSQQHHPNCPHHQPSNTTTTPPPTTYPPLPAQQPLQQNHNNVTIPPPKHHNHHHQPLRQQHIRHHHHHHSKSTATPPTMHQHQPQHHRRQASVPVIHPQHQQPLPPQHQQQQQGAGDEGSLMTWFSRYQVQRNSGNVSGVVYEDEHDGYHDDHVIGGGERIQTLTPNRS